MSLGSMEHLSERPVVGVSPPQALAERRRLFDALGEAIGFTFRASGGDRDAATALVHIGCPSKAIVADCPVFLAGQPMNDTQPTEVALSNGVRVPVPLRGRRMVDQDVLRGKPLLPG